MHRTLLTLFSLVLAAPVLAQRPNPGPSPRPDAARDAALRAITPLTAGVREDDHPALAVSGEVAWLVWVSYSDERGAARVLARSYDGRRWSDPETVTETDGDCHKPAIAIGGDGTVWVAWSAQVNGNWDIYGRARAGGVWQRVERWTTDAGPDLLPSLAASGDKLLVVWQSLRQSSFDILYRIRQARAWQAESFVTRSAANDWEPVAAAGRGGEFFVAWDSWRGDYDVMARTLGADGSWSPEVAVAGSPRLENHVSMSVDGEGRLWLAWETGPERWASDSAEGGLRARRDVGLACLDHGRLSRPRAAETALAALAGERGLQAPTLLAAPNGSLQLLARQPINNNWLQVVSAVWNGRAWSTLEPTLESAGRIDQRIVAAPFGNGALVCYPAGSSRNILYSRLLPGSTAAADRGVELERVEAAAPKPAPARPAAHTLGPYRLAWGDLHRHTDISEDGGIPDGSLMDAMRYAFDAAGLDFLGVTDHTRYLPRRYNLWRIQQTTDLFYGPGRFVPLHAYERSQYSPWGHRNVVNLRRDYTPVPASYDLGDTGVSPWGLFQALRGKRALTIPHTSAWANKQVSWDYYDPEIERLVEIYQGLRSTYEYNGAPDPADKAVYERDSRNFVWDALARKLKLGFIASSDHRSTHMSFACVYTRSIDRDAIFEALSARRTYAATDRILLDFTLGEHLMGEEVVVSGPPELAVSVTGTAPIERIDVIKDGAFVYTAKPGAAAARFTYRDQDYRGGEAYYYVRVIQTDKMMAWSSPIWVSGGKR
jgi:hypothetical protein